MRELELRLALVCYGGASLAIYMNGITAEILNLVRGSRNHCQSDIYPRFQRDSETSTDVYHNLLEELSPVVKIRVIVDVISGASAGGINGIMLSRALAHDLDFMPVKKMWLQLGDIEELMDADTLAGPWSKPYMIPIMKLFGRRLAGPAFDDPEMKHKIMRFVRSRWFKAPFSGDIMLDWMLMAARDMGRSQTSSCSLLPLGHRLDLFVPITNFHGQKKIIPLHDPESITEPKHQITLKFSHTRGFGDRNGQHGLADHNIPALGFAARATSSYPGAFPSVSFDDLERRMHALDLGWDFKDSFLAQNFPDYRLHYDRLKTMSFIDGGVTNNKPFDAAIQAIRHRPAMRRVDRRVIFIDPLPQTEIQDQLLQLPAPGFFKTIVGSLTTIPRAEPIYNDLQNIELHNQEARKLKGLNSAIMHMAQQNAADFIAEKHMKGLTVPLLAAWRTQSHEQARKQAGSSYRPYGMTKVHYIKDQLKYLLMALYGSDEKTMFSQVKKWAIDQQIDDVQGVQGQKSDASASDPVAKTAQGSDAVIELFRTLDVTFRIRRLRYVIEEINQLMMSDEYLTDLDALDRVKDVCYTMADDFSRFEHIEAYTHLSFDMDAPIDAAITTIKQHADLESKDNRLDELLIASLLEVQSLYLRHAIIKSYIGFTFFDVLSLPYQSGFDYNTKAEVKVDRISPHECQTILGHDFSAPLRGTSLYNFGAFFSRRARENDYLWGRVHAAIRQLDFIFNAAEKYGMPASIDKKNYQRRLIAAILREESHSLTSISETIQSLKSVFDL